MAAEWGEGGVDDLIREISHHLERDNQDVKALRQRAEYHNLREDWAGVAADLEAVRKLEPGAKFGIILAHAYEALGRIPEAEAEYTLEAASADMLEMPLLLAGRARVRRRRGDASGSLEDLKAAVSLQPSEPWLLAELKRFEEEILKGSGTPSRDAGP